MKFVEDSAAQLVLQDTAVNERLGAGGLVVVGLIVLVGGGLSIKNWAVYIFGVAFLLIGGFLLLSNKSNTITADKANRRLIITSTSLRNRAGTAQSFGFDEIDSIQTAEDYRTTRGSDAKTQTVAQLTLAAVLHTGDAVLLGTEQRAVGSASGDTASILAGQGQALAETIGVPFAQIDEADTTAAPPATITNYNNYGAPPAGALPRPPQTTVSPSTPSPVLVTSAVTPVEPPIQQPVVAADTSPTVEVVLQPQPSQVIQPQTQAASQPPEQPPAAPPAA